MADETTKGPPPDGHVTSHEVVGVTRVCVPRSDTLVALGLEKAQPSLSQSAAVRGLQVGSVARGWGKGLRT